MTALPRRPAAPGNPTLWQSVGGMPGLALSSVPSAVFVFVDEGFGLGAGITVALCAGLACAAFRAAAKQPLRPIAGGFVGLGISSALAWRTGSARDYFLPDIWFSAATAAVLTVSVLVGRPLVGVAWSALRGTGAAWRQDARSLAGYQIATATLATTYALRFAVEHWLYDRRAAGWMVAAKLAVNYPLLALAMCVTAWAVRRADRRLPQRATSEQEHSEHAHSEPADPGQ